MIIWFLPLPGLLFFLIIVLISLKHFGHTLLKRAVPLSFFFCARNSTSKAFFTHSPPSPACNAILAVQTPGEFPLGPDR